MSKTILTGGLIGTAFLASVGAVTLLGIGAKPKPASEYPKPAVVVTGDSYEDCLALADIDGFAPEVCEPLSPVKRNEVTVSGIDCPTEDSCTVAYGNGKWHVRRDVP